MSGVYDWNGRKKPNKLGKDVRTLGMAGGLGTECTIELGDRCFTAPFMPSPLTRSECEAQKGALGIKACYYGNDYWAGAVKQCGGVQNMPTDEDLLELAKLLYNTPSIEPSGSTWSLTLNSSKATTMGFSFSPYTKYPEFSIWSGCEAASSKAYIRDFASFSTKYYYEGYRQSGYGYNAMCLGD